MKRSGFIYLCLIVSISALGGLLFGYDWVVIGGAKPFYESFYGIADAPMLQGWAMSCALVGCLLGALLAGMFSDRYGRKRMLLVAAVLFIGSAVGTGTANVFGWFVFYRILGGLAIGIASNLSPIYIAEVSPARMRGRLVSLNQLAIVVGILLAQIANWLIAEPVDGGGGLPGEGNWNTEMGWRWMFWAENIPALLFLILIFFIPESPRWLAVRGKRDKSLNILEKIGGREYAVREYEVIQETLNQTKSEYGWKKLRGSGLKRILWIGVALAVFQQWCGINVIFNYAHEIFTAAGYGVSDMLMNVVITGVTNLIFTVVAMFMVDRWGRRSLLLLGAGGLALIYALMGLAYWQEWNGWPLLGIVVLAIACYAMSLAPVVWVVLSEIFPNRIRGLAMSVSTFGLWGASFILTYTFPILNDGLGAAGTFWGYGLVCLLGFGFIRKMLPETKGKSLEEIERMMIEK